MYVCQGEDCAQQANSTEFQLCFPELKFLQSADLKCWAKKKGRNREMDAIIKARIEEIVKKTSRVRTRYKKRKVIDRPAGKEMRTEIWYASHGYGGTDVHLRAHYYHEVVLFQGGDSGYHSFRIPAIVTTNNGTLVAFCEGRKNSAKDWGDIDVVYRRSVNHGVTWSEVKLLFSKHGGTCGNPTPVVDRETRAIWIFMSYNDKFHQQSNIDEWGERRVYSNVSYDDGVTWDALVNRTGGLVPPTYCWDALGPGNGIQVEAGISSGRLIIPAIGRNIFSDDNGESWAYQPIIPGTSEGTIVQLCNGDLMRNDRAACTNPCPPPVGDCSLKNRKRRQISVSADQGNTWSEWASNETLLDPLCQASILRYNRSYPHRLIFINPASTVRRHKMRVRISYDDGQTWPIQRYLDPDSGGYSSLTKSADFMVASLQEIGADLTGKHSIIFRKFNLPWILNGTPEPVPIPSAVDG